METSRNLKKWLWNNDSSGKKVRNASLEKAEEMVASSSALQQKQIGKVNNFLGFIIVKFWCKECKDRHFWGGPKKYMLSVNPQSLCPKKSKRVYLDKKYEDVPFSHAYSYANWPIRKLKLKEQETKLNPFI